MISTRNLFYQILPQFLNCFSSKFFANAFVNVLLHMFLNSIFWTFYSFFEDANYSFGFFEWLRPVVQRKARNAATSFFKPGASRRR